MKPSVLCVDDDPDILLGLKMNLRKHFEVSTFQDAKQALEFLRDSPDISVILSDMRMPNMNGAQFLSECKNVHSKATRMLLTGYSEMESAIKAVNEGEIFRLLTKPCSPQSLLNAFQSAQQQHDLLNAEKDLLEKTVRGSIQVLIEILSLAAPAAFCRAQLIEKYVSHMAKSLGLERVWIYEIAALLSKIGCITLAPETLSKALAGQALDEQEKGQFESFPEQGAKLLSQIPRLEIAASIVEKHRHPATDWPENPESTDEGTIAVGSAMLWVATEFDQLISQGASINRAVGQLRRSEIPFPEPLLEAIGQLENAALAPTVVKVVAIKQLHSGMVLDENLCTNQGTVLCRAGTVLSRPLLSRIENFAQGAGLPDSIRVKVVH